MARRSGKKRMTLEDVARLAGVSKTTVSLVLNDKDGVGAEKREEILRIVEETGYQWKARGKRQGQRNTVRFVKYKEQGFMVEQNGDFISRITDGMEQMAHRNDMILSITNVSADNLEEMIPKINEEEDFGIVFLATEFPPNRAEVLSKFHAPLVILDNEMRWQNYNVVVMDNAYAIYMAVKHLYEMGHRRIGHITTQCPISNMEARTHAFGDVMQSLGLTWESRYAYTTADDIDSYCDSLLEQLDPNDLPTALVADNDTIAINALLALDKLGKRVPEDVSVMGIDDLTISAITRPELTTVRLEKTRMGRLAIERVLSIAEGDSAPMKIFTGAKLIRRKSVARILPESDRQWKGGGTC